MILGIAGISTNRGGRCRSETDILSGKWNYETERRIPWSERGKYGSGHGHPCEIIEHLNMSDVPCPSPLAPPWPLPGPRSNENSSNKRKTWIIVVIFSSETSDRRRETRHIKYIKSNQRSKQFWHLTFVTRTIWCLDSYWAERTELLFFLHIIPMKTSPR